MSKPDEIPQDIFEAAFSVLSDIQMEDVKVTPPWDADASIERIARTILAERARCAKIADNWKQDRRLTPEPSPAYRLHQVADEIAAAIRGTT